MRDTWSKGLPSQDIPSVDVNRAAVTSRAPQMLFFIMIVMHIIKNRTTEWECQSYQGIVFIDALMHIFINGVTGWELQRSQNMHIHCNFHAYIQ